MIARILSFQAQAPRQPSDQPRFDVASIQINKANDDVGLQPVAEGRCRIGGFTLAALIRSAYRVQGFRSSRPLIDCG